MLFRCLFFVVLLMGFVSQAIAQNNDSAQALPGIVKQGRNLYRNELQITSDNDNYTLQIRDGYYTNGLFISFNRAGITKRGKKQMHHFSIGQQIFNPIRFDSNNLSGQDRPFTGYLYGRYGQRIMPHADAMLEWNISAGFTGKASLAEQVQRWYHRAIGIYDVTGWNTQLNTEFSLNASLFYTQSILAKNALRSWDAAPILHVEAGNYFTGITSGITLRAGKPEQLANSGHYHNRVSARKTTSPARDKEFYAFAEPLLTWQAYNASLQGGLFIDDKGPKTVDVRPLVFSSRYGFVLSQNRMTWKMYYMHRKRQAKQQIRPENFVSIQLAYRFKPYAL